MSFRVSLVVASNRHHYATFHLIGFGTVGFSHGYAHRGEIRKACYSGLLAAWMLWQPTRDCVAGLPGEE